VDKQIQKYLLNKTSIKMMVGFAAYWAWADTAYRTSSLFQFFDDTLTQLHAANLADVLAAVGIAFFAAVFTKQVMRILERQVLIMAVSIGAVIGTALAGFSGLLDNEALSLVGAVLSGLCMGTMILLWAGKYATDEENRGGVWIAGTIALGTVLCLAISLLQPIACVVAVSLLPLLGGTCLFFTPVSYGSLKGSALPARGAGSDAESPASLGNLPPVSLLMQPDIVQAKQVEVFGLPWRLAVGLMVYTCAWALMQFLFDPASLTEYSQASILQLGGRLLVAIAIFVGLALFGWKPLMTYRIGLLLMVAGFLLLPFIKGADGRISLTIAMMGYTCFYLMVWAVLLEIAKTAQASMIRLFGGAFLVSMTGVLAGTIAGYVVSASKPDSMQLVAITTAMVYLLMTVTILVLSENHVFGYWQLIRTASFKDDKTQWTQNCTVLACTFKLTPRESEVLLLLANGRSAPYISQNLHVSDSTARTHIRSIYDKLGVHNKQDLLDRIANVETGN
jgi:DNA-binding CsgD family transcriptional regulator